MKHYINEVHLGNIYLDITEEECQNIDVTDFDKLMVQYRKSLQVNVYSYQTKIIDLLLKSGFALKRKCYECEVTVNDLVRPLKKIDDKVMFSYTGETIYNICVQKLYQHYYQTHLLVNPLTVEIDQFAQYLPGKVMYSMDEHMQIQSVAFIEENKIAYVVSDNKDDFNDFIQVVVKYLFQHYTTIFFEADNTDWVAMQLKALFNLEDKISFDAYIKKF